MRGFYTATTTRAPANSSIFDFHSGCARFQIPNRMLHSFILFTLCADSHSHLVLWHGLCSCWTFYCGFTLLKNKLRYAQYAYRRMRNRLFQRCLRRWNQVNSWASIHRTQRLTAENSPIIFHHCTIPYFSCVTHGGRRHCLSGTSLPHYNC